MDRTSAYALVILVTGSVAWFVPFPLHGWSSTAPQTRDPKWRWGLLLEVIAYAVAGAGGLRITTLPGWRLAVAALFFVLASVLSWTGTRSLGRYLRFEAAIEADHQLVRSGPYRFIRHPNYAIVIGEIAVVPLALGLPIYALLFSVLNVIVLSIRIPQENAALAANALDGRR